MATDGTGGLAPWERALCWVDQRFFSVESIFNFIAALVILMLMMLGVIQVVGRLPFLNTSVAGYIDWVEVFMGTFVFLGIAYCQRLGTHVRMEIVIARFRGRLLWVIEFYGVLAMMFIIGVLMYYGYGHFERALQIGDSTMDIRLPLWPSKLMVPLAFALLMVRLTIQLVGYGRLIAMPAATPLAVPLIADLQAQVQHELDDAFGRGAVEYRHPTDGDGGGAAR